MHHAPVMDTRITPGLLACVPFVVAFVGCAGPPAKAPEPRSTVTLTAAEIASDPRTEPRPAVEPDYHARATANADAVIESMHDDLLACYDKRVAANPNAHGSITVEMVVDPSGHVSAVETTGGALLGDGTMKCIVQRVKKASFDPPHGGGTMRIQVPLSLRRAADGDESF
jgi:hypothetical protein